MAVNFKGHEWWHGAAHIISASHTGDSWLRYAELLLVAREFRSYQQHSKFKISISRFALQKFSGFCKLKLGNPFSMTHFSIELWSIHQNDTSNWKVFVEQRNMLLVALNLRRWLLEREDICALQQLHSIFEKFWDQVSETQRLFTTFCYYISTFFSVSFAIIPVIILGPFTISVQRTFFWICFFFHGHYYQRTFSWVIFHGRCYQQRLQ